MLTAINPKLTIVARSYFRQGKSGAKELLDRYSDVKFGWDGEYPNMIRVEKSRTLFPVTDNVEHACNFHFGVVDYLDSCWMNHFIPQICPGMIWQLVLGGVTELVAERPEQFRALFSRSAEKQTIIVAGIPERPEQFVPLLTAVLNKLMPIGTKRFLPEFGTDTASLRFAREVSLLDAVSPYYDYGVKACGLPAIRVLGGIDDWNRLRAAVEDVAELFPDESSWFDRLAGTLRGLNPGDSRWRDFYNAERCGSGSDYEVTGWILDLFRKHDRSKPQMPHNLPSGSGRMKFKDLSTDRNYELVSGLFSSFPQEQELKPCWNWILYEKKISA